MVTNPISDLLEHLIQLRNKEISERLHDEQRRVRFEARHPYDGSPPHPHIQSDRIVWIEQLLEKPLDDFRKYCVTFIFAPYFINIRRLSDLDTFDRIVAWLERCRPVRRLDFNAKQRVKYDIKRKLQRARRLLL